MRLDRYAIAALAGAAALFAGAGAALAGPKDDDHGARCETRLGKIAEKRGVDVQQLKATLEARLQERLAKAVANGRLTAEQAQRVAERIESGSFCPAVRQAKKAHAARGLLAAAADYLGLSKDELKAQLPGASLAALAAKQGKSVEGLKAAMLAPAKERLAKAVADGKITGERADLALARLGQLVDRLVTKTFPTT